MVLLMGKVSFVVITVLSVLITYLLPYLNLFFPINTGVFGFPLQYGTSSFFGGSSFEQLPFLVDVGFWFVVVWSVWVVFKKFFNR